MTDGSEQTPPMKQAWNDAADGFAALGRTMKERYRSAVGEPETPDDDAELRAAFDRFVEAGRDLTDRVADVATDDEVKAQAKRTANSFESALTATVDEIAAQLSGLFDRSKHHDDTR
jgi:hypothetical protein